MKDLTVIIPLVEYTTEMKDMYDISFNSLFSTDEKEELNVIIIGPTSAIKVAKGYTWGSREVLFLENDKNTTLQHQINKAVKDVKTTYFSLLEFDDKFNSFWFNEVERYMEHYPETSLFLPLVEVFDFQNKTLGSVGYANEPVWSSSFSEELGYLDIEALKNYSNFIVSGGVFKKSDFVSVGGLKPSLNVFFWYEFLLRLCHNNKKAYVIPKVGYEHAVNRDGSLTTDFFALSKDELQFWFETAQTEYLYKTDRKKTYVVNS